MTKSFNDGFQEARRGNSSTELLIGSKSSIDSSEEIKAPITIINETGQDITVTVCNSWVEIDKNVSRTSSIASYQNRQAVSFAQNSNTLHPLHTPNHYRKVIQNHYCITFFRIARPTLNRLTSNFECVLGGAGWSQVGRYHSETYIKRKLSTS